jgi:hypothetical protein
MSLLSLSLTRVKPRPIKEENTKSLTCYLDETLIMAANLSNRDTRNAPRSAKNHTCYFWAKGGCKYSEEECLYAHRPTGKTANQPVRLEPGRKFSCPNTLTQHVLI